MHTQVTVVVTGVGQYWGRRVAQKLLQDADYHVIGIDTDTPREALPGLDFVQADIRHPLMKDLLRVERVQAIAHLDFQFSLQRSEKTFDYNYNGTFKLLGSAANAGVQQVVLPSSTLVYGSREHLPTYVREDAELSGRSRFGYLRDQFELDSFVNGYRMQAPGMQLAILRFAPIVGPTCSTPWTQWLKSMRVPTLWGFDPLVQVVHEDDVVAALVHTLQRGVGGTFNIAAPEALTVARLVRLSGGTPLPLAHPLVYASINLSRQCGLPLDPEFLQFGCCSETTLMRDQLEFEPAYDALATVAALAEKRRSAQYVQPQEMSRAAQERLRAILERRRSAAKAAKGER
ncbi:MAG: NAD-dependent epimerase/dehydratase family protein [Chloroflexi bacterium]|nr:NAD-dependent epimerase/dehydratase family protein [Chloroflexota bacterium]